MLNQIWQTFWIILTYKTDIKRNKKLSESSLEGQNFKMRFSRFDEKKVIEVAEVTNDMCFIRSSFW